jgi:hypothetical protein
MTRFLTSRLVMNHVWLGRAWPREPWAVWDRHGEKKAGEFSESLAQERL